MVEEVPKDVRVFYLFEAQISKMEEGSSKVQDKPLKKEAAP